MNTTLQYRNRQKFEKIKGLLGKKRPPEEGKAGTSKGKKKEDRFDVFLYRNQ